MRRALILLMLILMACSRDLVSPVPECPCMSGWRCCRATNTCVLLNDPLCPDPPKLTGISPSMGPAGGGTEVVIFGAGFYPELVPFIGERSCREPALLSAYAIQCRAPPSLTGTQQAAIALLQETKEVARLDAAYEYINTDWAVMSVEPLEVPREGGVDLTINGTGFTDELRVFVANKVCDVRHLDSQRIQCTVPPADPGLIEAAIRIEPTGRFGLDVVIDYLQPRFEEVTGAARLGSAGEGSGLALFDQNGDALPELYLTDATAERITSNERILFENLGELQFADITGPWARELVGHQSVAAADFNNDGRTDLLVGQGARSQSAQVPAVLLLGEDGGFRAVDQTDLLEPNAEVVALMPVDLDADGHLDVVGLRQSASHPIMVAMQRGGSLVEDPTRVETGTVSWAGATLGDMDRDGDPDLMVCRDRFAYFENIDGRFVETTTRAGSFAPFPIGSRCQSIHAVDFDMDGDLDLALNFEGSAGGNQKGSRNLSGTILYELMSPGEVYRILFLPVAGLDRDEAALPCDIINHNVADHSLKAGAGTAAWADFDLDGDLDLFSPFPFPICVSAPMIYDSHYAQPGREIGFSPILLPRLRPLGGYGGAAAADLDADGDLDLVTHTGYLGVGGYRWSLVKNNLMQNGHTSRGAQGRFLIIEALTDADGDATDNDANPDRRATGITVELDLNGPDDPQRVDFARGRRQLMIRAIGPGGISASEPSLAHFGIPLDIDAVWARVRFADKTVVVQRIDRFNARVTVRDCAALECIVE